MAIPFRHAPEMASGRGSFNSRRATRKIAIFGAHMPSLTDAPWLDDSWELWGHATARLFYSRPMDRYFDLHPPSCWTRGGKKGAKYPEWLSKQTTPIYMQQRYTEVPASIEYPRRKVFQEFAYAHGRRYFTNHVAWMVALAIMEGATTIGLWGINYAIQSEYIRQRGGAEYWLGVLDGRGINVVLPEQCSLLQDPPTLYGYASHDIVTGKLLPEYAKKDWPNHPMNPGDKSEKAAIPTPEIAAQMRDEEIEHPRPAWMEAFMAGRPFPRTDGAEENA